MLIIADFLRIDSLIMLLIVYHIFPKMNAEAVLITISYLNHKMSIKAEGN